ncbi:hypothetical protein BN1012_Phect1894 [Candidatus Phaeomarinobacter ectocarpi]|uniref:Uncharacterized protein n=1 Tax=Candidatus Phaeomarinibacter ectocarpi TaxID=1458461 RepID=X5MDE1_9HYPH|nr:hypothetical protein BN1012_Phect1894 [Candidatus Phaeomarinobacter ectocarpi]
MISPSGWKSSKTIPLRRPLGDPATILRQQKVCDRFRLKYAKRARRYG